MLTLVVRYKRESTQYMNRNMPLCSPQTHFNELIYLQKRATRILDNNSNTPSVLSSLNSPRPRTITYPTLLTQAQMMADNPRHEAMVVEDETRIFNRHPDRRAIGPFEYQKFVDRKPTHPASNHFRSKYIALTKCSGSELATCAQQRLLSRITPFSSQGVASSC